MEMIQTNHDHSFGDLLVESQTSAENRARQLIGGAIFLALVVIGLGTGIIRGDITNFSNISFGQIFLLVVMGAMSLIGIMGILAFFLNVGNHIRVYENGIIYKGFFVNRWSWEDLDRIEFQHVGISCVNGQVRAISAGLFFLNVYRDGLLAFAISNEYGNYQTLSDVLLHKTQEHLLPLHRGRLAKGETINYDEVQINHSGITKGAEHLAWWQITHVDIVDDSFYHIHADEVSLVGAVRRTDNIHVLLPLIEEMIATHSYAGEEALDIRRPEPAFVSG